MVNLWLQCSAKKTCSWKFKLMKRMKIYVHWAQQIALRKIARNCKYFCSEWTPQNCFLILEVAYRRGCMHIIRIGEFTHYYKLISNALRQLRNILTCAKAQYMEDQLLKWKHIQMGIPNMLILEALFILISIRNTQRLLNDPYLHSCVSLYEHAL